MQCRQSDDEEGGEDVIGGGGFGGFVILAREIGKERMLQFGLELLLLQ